MLKARFSVREWDNREEEGKMGKNNVGISSKNLSFFGLLILIAGIVSPSFGQVPLAKQRTITIGPNTYLLTSKLTHLLIGSFFYNYNHTIGTPNLETTLRRIGAAETPPWVVDISTLGTDITAAKLAGYQVFFANYISSWASGTGFPNAGRTAVQNYVEQSGGGVCIMHSSGDSRLTTNWPWFYNVAHPVIYIGESSRTGVSAPVFIPAAGKTHVVMQGMNFSASPTPGLGPDTVIFPQGEWHQFTNIITSIYPNAEIFLRMIGQRCTNGGTGTNCGTTYNYSVPGGYPATWTFPDMKGRIGYFMEGHDLITQTAMTTAMWDRFFKQFMYYLAGYDTTLVTSVGPHSNPGFELDRSGITFHPDDVGVLITKPGAHLVSICDIAGRQIKAMRGDRAPVDYNFSREIKGAGKGIYVVRVAVAGGVKSKRFLIE